MKPQATARIVSDRESVAERTLRAPAAKEARDALVKYGAPAGAKVAWDRRAELQARV